MRCMILMLVLLGVAACAGPSSRGSTQDTAKRAEQTRGLDELCRTYEAQRSDPRCRDYRSGRRPADDAGGLPVEIPPQLPVQVP